MDDKSLNAAILGLKDPWGIEKVELPLGRGEVHVSVALPADTLWVCPDCLAAAPIHDHRKRRWRYLDLSVPDADPRPGPHPAGRSSPSSAC